MRCKTWTLGNPNQGRVLAFKWDWKVDSAIYFYPALLCSMILLQQNKPITFCHTHMHMHTNTDNHSGWERSMSLICMVEGHFSTVWHLFRSLLLARPLQILCLISRAGWRAYRRAGPKVVVTKSLCHFLGLCLNFICSLASFATTSDNAYYLRWCIKT